MSRGELDRTIVVREAQPFEANRLSALALESKAYWGYSDEFMAACRDELRVSSDKISSPSFYYAVAETRENIAGFYALERLSDTDYELDALFVMPECIGTGVGRVLMNHAKGEVIARGGQQLRIQGDPNAAQFYLAAGATHVGERESGSIPGRVLPLYLWMK